jgi:Yip1 domain
MSDTATALQPLAADRSLAARLVGVVFSPGDTFRGIAAHPRWLGAMAVIVAIVAGANFALLSTEVGQQALLDQQIRSAESWGRTLTDEQQDRMERMLPMMRYITLASTVVMVPVITFALAGVLYAVFNAGLGGDARYRQVLAVLTHAGAISAVGAFFITPLNYARESLSSATNLGVFLPFLDEGSLPARFLGMIDLFLIWWVIVIGIGLSMLYRRRTGPVVVSLLATYLVIAAVIAVVMRAFAGSQ